MENIERETINVFKAMASSSWGFREEFTSGILACLFATGVNGKNSYAFLEKFITAAGIDINDYSDLKGIVLPDSLDDEITGKLAGRDIIKEEESRNIIEVQLERGRVDILIRYKNTLFVVENKILDTSIGNIGNQIRGYLKDIKLPEHLKIIPICILPDNQTRNQIRSRGYYAVSWSDIVIDKTLFNVDWSEFVENKFSGYDGGISTVNKKWETTVGNVIRKDYSNFDDEILKAGNSLYVGPTPILYLIEKLYNISDNEFHKFMSDSVFLSEQSAGFRYLPEEIFRAIVKWFEAPEKNTLTLPTSEDCKNTQEIPLNNATGIRIAYKFAATLNKNELNPPYYIHIRDYKSESELENITWEKLKTLDWKKVKIKSECGRQGIGCNEFVKIIDKKIGKDKNLLEELP